MRKYQRKYQYSVKADKETAELLRAIARAEDRPISYVLRRWVHREAQRIGLSLSSANNDAFDCTTRPPRVRVEEEQNARQKERGGAAR